MKDNYSSKQKRIYEEYILYSSEMLNRMMNDKKNHKGDVIRIVADILAERNRGFYTPAVKAPEPEEIKEDNKHAAGEFAEDDGGNVVYEEVPWLTKKTITFPGITEAMGEYMNESLNSLLEGEEEVAFDEDDINIEEEKTKYWKCAGCNELSEMQYDICWNCQSEKPEVIVHPDAKEVIKEIREGMGE